MDSCGRFLCAEPNGYLTAAALVSNPNALLMGMILPLTRLRSRRHTGCMRRYVSFRRSLDPSLTEFRRFWTNGVLGAESSLWSAGASITPLALANPPR